MTVNFGLCLSPRHVLYALIMTGSWSACHGSVGLDGDFEPDSTWPDKNGVYKTPPALPGVPTPDAGCVALECQREAPTKSMRVSRLTHVQWENAVRDILELPERSGLSSTFIQDTLSSSYFNRDTSTLEVVPALWDDYREAAETLAAQVANDPATQARLLPKDATSTTGRAQAQALLEVIGRRAYRRPWTANEVTRHLQIYDEAPQHFDSGEDAHRVGLLLMLSAVFQSPWFIYRTELTATHGEMTRLNSYEIATKLALALWNSVPDDALLDAAASGALDTLDGVEAQARRLLEDKRAKEMVLDFYDQVLHFSQWSKLDKSSAMFPQYSPEVAAAMRREMELFLEDIIFEDSGSFLDLLTSTSSFVNEPLANIYGLEGIKGTEFVKVELDAKTRPGFMTRAGFLAYMAGYEHPAPIQRGVFINHHVVCSKLPPAPNEINGDAFEGATNRDRWAHMTGSCGGSCHNNYINPPGFSFEHFDAIGQWRAMDNGHAIETAGRFAYDGKSLEFTDASDFIGKLAKQEDAHHCYADHWFEYMYGRAPKESEAPLVARIASASRKHELSVKNGIIALVTSDAFLYRAP